MLIVGSHIAGVGQDIQDKSARKVDLTGRIVLPGFVDAHNHLWSSMLRGCGSGGDLYGWLNHCQYPLMEEPVPVETVYGVVRLSALKRQGKLVGDVGSVIERAQRDVAVIKGMVEKAQSND